MSVIVLDDNGYCSFDRYENKSPQKEKKYPSLGDVRNFLNRKHRKPEELLKDTSVNLSNSIVSIHEESCEFDKSVEIIGEGAKACDRTFEAEKSLGEDSITVLERSVGVIEPETLLKTPEQVLKRKRSSSDSSIDESPFNSPEIPLTGSPIIYQLCESNNTKIIIKKAMSQKKPEPRAKKCTDRDISSLLDSDEDEPIFDKKARTPKNSETPRKLLKNAESTPRSSPRSKEKLEETPKKEEGGIRMKLRRSTEQSNYKIEALDFDSRDRRSSLRTKIVLPRRYADSESEKPLRRTPSRTAKSVQYYEEPNSLENSFEVETPKKSRHSPETPEDNSTPRTRVSRSKNESGVLKSVPRTPSSRPRRSTRSAKQDNDVNDHGANENDTNKGNKTDESDNETEMKQMDRKRRLNEEKPTTPRKSLITNEVETPKKSLRSVDTKTPKKSVKIIEEAKTPRRTPRRIQEETPKRSAKLESVAEEPVTPKHRGKATKSQTPSLKHGNLTPSMHQRRANVGKPRTLLQEARAQLHVSAVPKSLPCREEEFNNIFTFLQRKLVDHSSGCIYISGVPGTGKTATVNEVIRCLRRLVTKSELDEFDYLEINGMKLTEPRQAYVQILKHMNGQSLTWEQAYQILERKFTKSSGHRPMTLLLVDELDLLCNKRQDVVYNLLDWPAKQGAQLVVITIANTMDLPERVLMGRVTSRLGLTRLTFQPYNHKQLQEIVTTRLNDSEAFRSEAIQLVARKVAAVSGDARRALDICRRATEIAEAHGGKIVSMQDVNEALTEMIASAKVRAIKLCSEMEKVFLQAVCAEISRTGVEEASFESVYKQFEALCSFEGVKTPNISETLGICSRLSANRLLLCEHSRTDIMQRILLNVSADDIHFALQSIEI